MRKRATMTDVAALAGVSLKTVSRVVNGEPGVSPDLVERVRRAVEQLDYRHNLAASNLRRGVRTQTIGVLLHDLRNEYAAELLRVIDDHARPLGVAVLASSLDDHEDREQVLVHDMVTRRVDGLVLMPASPDQSYLLPEVRAGLPVVAVDRPTAGLAVDTVVVDNRDGAHRATEYLLGRGHVRVACLTDRGRLWTARERLRGYLEAITEAGLPVDERIVVKDLVTADEATAATRALLDLADPPTAVFAGRNDLSVGVVRALRERALERRVAVVGFDDFPLADLMSPAVTVVSQRVTEIGATAAQLLFARMHGEAPTPRTVVVPTRLVERESGLIPVPVTFA
ncbi:MULTISPECIES: LacI family DNA-binding transcriptional regulator [unclassified Pseudofrankia]|uniref:LacI family DNA-binding transcriptional regulator n=1 Tax=unclassified Pseudofrankia TaxID=2994372 RepID=UPI0008D8F780|nr:MULTISPECIES: LacI family DNA-binding transcriptional regulator [unclassified Pseudofrankia]MDT3441165.1 LacI family DNA-binding transcriptional regulator [Pseudofrankia sp. BMG5.37]OHV54243.1 LacI family transcriptional regulator [Pseudofrankia sp. BMG5.36]